MADAPKTNHLSSLDTARAIKETDSTHQKSDKKEAKYGRHTVQRQAISNEIGHESVDSVHSSSSGMAVNALNTTPATSDPYTDTLSTLALLADFLSEAGLFNEASVVTKLLGRIIKDHEDEKEKKHEREKEEVQEEKRLSEKERLKKFALNQLNERLQKDNQLLKSYNKNKLLNDYLEKLQNSIG